MFDPRRLILPGILAFGILFVFAFSFYVVEPGYTALHLRMGRIIDSHTESGAYFKAPLVDTIIYINQRICKSEIETSALSKDLQTVSIEVAINYKINNAMQLYRTVGTNFEHVIINPFAQESIKAVIAKFTAEDLIQYRHTAKDKVFQELKERLFPLSIELIDFNFVHLDFSADFIKAVEEKQIAEQSAKTAKNLTEKVKEESLQIKSRAEAEAYSLNVKKSSVTPELIALKKTDAFIKAIDKWDGKLPHIMGGNAPFLLMNEEADKRSK